jgi:hypothetical protein
LIRKLVIGEFAVSIQQHIHWVYVDIRMHSQQHSVKQLVASEHLSDKIPSDAKVRPDFLEKEVREADSPCIQEGTGDEDKVQIVAETAVGVVPYCENWCICRVDE